jgi:hypothetical protein
MTSSGTNQGPIPTDDTGYVWPSWRQALVAADTGVAEAYERRRRMMQAAYDAGLSFRDIAGAVGKSPATIHKIIGKQRAGDDAARILDAPAGLTVDASAMPCDGSGGFGPPEGSGLIGWARCPGCVNCAASPDQEPAA